VLDAESDEKNEMQYDKELLNEKLTDIINNIASKLEEMNAYNNLHKIEFKQSDHHFNKDIYNNYYKLLNKPNNKINIDDIIDSFS